MKDLQMNNRQEPVPPSAQPVTPRRRVLLVDDTPEVRRDLRLLLELGGDIEIVAEAGNGQEAVQLADKLEPEVIVMDLEMPGMNGYEATRQIKRKHAATRVIILSVHAGPGERERAREAGAVGFVVKGASYQTLLATILAKGESTHPIDLKKGEEQ
jgi:NarL family two-component system response regulator LiaR